MKSTDALEPFNKFSYQIDFRYKKFDEDLKATDYIKASLIVSVDAPVRELMQRNWRSILQELNPDYFQIEVINVQDTTDEI